MNIHERVIIPQACLNSLHVCDLVAQDEGLVVEAEHVVESATHEETVNYIVESQSADNERRGLDPITVAEYRQGAARTLDAIDAKQDALAAKVLAIVSQCDGKGPLMLSAARGDLSVKVKICGSEFFKSGENVELVEVERLTTD